mmetsp:Transcript_4715/g.13208  ORF Transcript_4715/g.13208 Transcript_4715/m.13208 type:complete len:298 (+) Transcript_4715:862-1755(+)
MMPMFLPRGVSRTFISFTGAIICISPCGWLASRDGTKKHWNTLVSCKKSHRRAWTAWSSSWGVPFLLEPCFWNRTTLCAGMSGFALGNGRNFLPNLYQRTPPFTPSPSPLLTMPGVSPTRLPTGSKRRKKCESYFTNPSRIPNSRVFFFTTSLSLPRMGRLVRARSRQRCWTARLLTARVSLTRRSRRCGKPFSLMPASLTTSHGVGWSPPATRLGRCSWNRVIPKKLRRCTAPISSSTRITCGVSWACVIVSSPRVETTRRNRSMSCSRRSLLGPIPPPSTLASAPVCPSNEGLLS